MRDSSLPSVAQNTCVETGYDPRTEKTCPYTYTKISLCLCGESKIYCPLQSFLPKADAFNVIGLGEEIEGRNLFRGVTASGQVFSVPR